MSEQKKPSGWFSRRHESRDAHAEAVATYRENHGPTARQRRAVKRANIADRVTTYACGHKHGSRQAERCEVAR